MISSKGLFYHDEKTKLLLDMKNEKRPVAVQIFGNDIEAMKYASKYVSRFADIIDINMGCPAPKVVKNGDGSKLLLNLDLAGRIVEEVVKSVDIPVTVKMRKGWDNQNIVAIEAAKIFEQAGASAIAIHGRTRDQFYTGRTDLEIIKQVKQSVSIPVIGNGDIKTPNDAIQMFQKTNVDGIMIGRASMGNPWIFKDILDTLSNKEPKIVDPKEKLEIIIKHIELAVEQKGEILAIKEMRKHIAAYIKNMREASRLRDKVNKIETKQELILVLTEYFKNI